MNRFLFVRFRRCKNSSPAVRWLKKYTFHLNGLLKQFGRC